MSNAKTCSEMDESQVAYLRRHARVLADLPSPGEHWDSDDVPEAIVAKLETLRNRGIVRRVDKQWCDHHGALRSIWRTDEAAYQRLETMLEPSADAPLPCGHGAIRNERGVDGITCRICGVVHDRAEVGR